MNNYESLTPRQKEVLRWRAYGFSKDKVARKMKIAYSTLDMHLWRIYERLGIERTATQYNPAGLATIIYWQNNPEELKSVYIEKLWESNKTT